MKILVVYTGGTIGMVKDTETGLLRPGSIHGINIFLEQEKLYEFCDVVSFENPIDSSDFSKEYYSELSQIVKENYYDYDSFLILMGTDTMSYVSSLLSFCITGLSKPIIFTGGQKTLYEVNSDSTDNFRNSFQGLLNNKFLNEVGIYFAAKWHRAVSATKIDSYGNDAFRSKFKKNVNLVQEDFNIITRVTSNIVVLKLTPFHDEEVFFSLLNNKSIHGIVLEVFGSGNMPKLSTVLESLFKERIQAGLKVVISSQCEKDNGLESRYESGLTSLKLGFLRGKNMTKESIVSKLMFLLEKKINIDEFKYVFELSNRGE